jgi:hypothetical protein
LRTRSGERNPVSGHPNVVVNRDWVVDRVEGGVEMEGQKSRLNRTNETIYNSHPHDKNSRIKKRATSLKILQQTYNLLRPQSFL